MLTPRLGGGECWPKSQRYEAMLEKREGVKMKGQKEAALGA